MVCKTKLTPKRKKSVNHYLPRFNKMTDKDWLMMYFRCSGGIYLTSEIIRLFCFSSWWKSVKCIGCHLSLLETVAKNIVRFFSGSRMPIWIYLFIYDYLRILIYVFIFVLFCFYILPVCQEAKVARWKLGYIEFWTYCLTCYVILPL